MAFEEKDILKMMKNLDLTREEAIQLLKDDENDISVNLTAEQQKVASTMMRADSKPGKSRLRKPNEIRRYLMKYLADTLNEITDDEVIITNNERELSFVYNHETYRLTLAKPRDKKD